jgi:HrpA-like RNA helicase
MLEFRKQLPAFQARDEILNSVRQNTTVVIVGDTGCGKTTQVPQLILDDCLARGEPCNIICTQVRKLVFLFVHH